MFFFFSKILEFIITPIFWIFALLLAGLLAKKQPLKKRLLIASIICFYFFSNSFILNECMVRWEVPAIKDSALQGKYDVAIVLGGMIEYDDHLDRVQFAHGGDRLFQALRLCKQGKVKKILLDGGSGSLDGHTVEAPILRKFLVEMGIPDSVLLMESHSRNTHENATFAKHILDSVAPNGRYLLFTSGYHMRRAIGCFNKAGIHTLPYTTDRTAGPLKFQIDYMLIPDVGALHHWETLIHEWIGYMSYKIAGYI
jgi:uncharacterized SAM-binding protein YcdF (DUF218 family)